MTNPWFDTLAVFDLETTGIDVESSRIVSAHVGVIDASGVVIEKTDWLADPGIEIPEQASAVHGITTERARAEGRPSIEVVGEIIASLNDVFARGLALTIYNAPYDLTLLNREARRHGLAPLASPGPIIDPLVLDRVVDKYRKGKRTLEAATEFYGIALTEAHDAGADAVAAGRLAQVLATRYGAQLAIEVADLHNLQIGWCADNAADFQSYMRRTKDENFVALGTWPEHP
jgi:DNA polymerase-3 subunit epsilon